MDLFDFIRTPQSEQPAPLAHRMRPRSLEEVAGQEHLLGSGSVLRTQIEQDRLTSLILYGPPGTGKTSLARVIAQTTRANYVQLQAVTAGVNDIRKIAADAKERLKFYQQKTIVFVDEVHRFNKSQQDVLLPFIEDGTLILIGATTENPLYELNNALLSRVRLYIMQPLNDKVMESIIKRALTDDQRGLGRYRIILDNESLDLVLAHSRGDARTALNILETLVNSFLHDDQLQIVPEMILQITDRPLVRYDKTGDYHYDSISAFIKSIRGSDPDAAVFWLAVMLEGGEDPVYVARRLVVHAAEDIGLADPHALPLAQAAAAAVQLIGMPEARIPLAEATLYLATAPKSNAAKVAIDEAIEAVRNSHGFNVPAHLGDTSHSKARVLLGKGNGYQYPPNFGGYVKQSYLPPEIEGASFYHPSLEGYEKQVRQFLEKIKNLQS